MQKSILAAILALLLTIGAILIVLLAKDDKPESLTDPTPIVTEVPMEDEGDA